MAEILRLAPPPPVVRRAAHSVFVVRSGAHIGAFELDSVIEVLRPLRAEPVAGAPPFVLGMSMLRGAPVPVVDLACLLTGTVGAADRWVALRVGGRRLAMAVDQVIGVSPVDVSSLAELPPLLRGARADVVAAVGRLDKELLVMLDAARALPEELWASLAAGGAS